MSWLVSLIDAIAIYCDNTKMCNAWNHPLDCHCGWGGEGHLGNAATNGLQAAGLNSYSDWVTKKYHSEARSYTTPNAKCPECGAAVYFYQSPHGGRVFFDDLGPPWPKHPCIVDASHKGNQTSKVNPPFSALTTQRLSSPGYSWQKEGWQPFICEAIVSAPGVKNCAVVSGLGFERHLSLFVREMTLLARAPFQIKVEGEHSYILSTVQYTQGELRVMNVRAFKSLRDLISRSSVVSTPPMAEPIRTPQKQTKPLLQQKSNPPQKRTKPNPKVEIKSVMKSAFEKVLGVNLD